jgi:peptidoglycan/LPS O-acetylase OafA/YrhL
MSTRYLSNAALGVAGGFLVVASQAFTYPTFEWLALGIGIVAVVLSAGVGFKNRGNVQRGLDVLTAAAGAWTIVETLLFSGAANTWLGFASGAAFVALALAGLTAHEFSTERVVHSFEISNSEHVEREYANAA